jgi:Uma2 family endonuclease
MDRRSAPLGLLTIDEYLEIEESSPIRHEFVGGSDRHNRIAINIVRRVAEAADDTPCRVYMADMRLRVGEVYYYPDVMVCCEPPSTVNPTERYDPCLLIEVLSPSTAATDRREKLLLYRGIPTLRAYLIVDQDTQHVERHVRRDDGTWMRTDHVTGGAVPLPCPATRLSVDDDYRGL